MVSQPTMANLADTNERRVSLVVGQLDLGQWAPTKFRRWPNERRVSSTVGSLDLGLDLPLFPSKIQKINFALQPTYNVHPPLPRFTPLLLLSPLSSPPSTS